MNRRELPGQGLRSIENNDVVGGRPTDQLRMPRVIRRIDMSLLTQSLDQDRDRLILERRT